MNLEAATDLWMEVEGCGPAFDSPGWWCLVGVVDRDRELAGDPVDESGSVVDRVDELPDAQYGDGLVAVRANAALGRGPGRLVGL
nr:hypothetical protein [Mycobacterium sp.]